MGADILDFTHNASRFNMECGFKINKEYAANYNKWRQKEELQRLKDKYGDVADEDGGSSSSESEDEDAEALTAKVEHDWLRAYAAVKARDPKIYQKDVTFYEDSSSSSNDGEKEKKKKNMKPVFLKDYERKVILEKKGIIESEDDENDETHFNQDPSYYEEQEEIKKSFKAAVGDSDVSDDDDDDTFLTKRKKSKAEEAKDEEDYLKWLKGQKELQTEETELVSLKTYWSDPKLDEGEKFLRDYILNKRYMDKGDESIPSYDDIINEEDLSEEDELLDKQEDFERKYNFRYEEPNADLIKSYPRTVKDSVRVKENKRAKKRQKAKERKQKEKEKKKEEIKQLKNLKKREIMDKIERLKEISGNPSIGLSEQDIDDDFDPAKHDALMKQVFDDSYYGMDVDETKPVFPDDEDLGLEEENWDNWAGPSEDQEGNYDDDENDEGPHCEDEDFNMDADYAASQEDRNFGLDGRSKKKKKSKFAQVLSKRKPVFDPTEKSFEEYFNEYYKLDYEDIIGDLPTRFKYRSVKSNDFGLSMDEILKARDKELNHWVSLKKMTQYRTEEEEDYDARAFQAKSKNLRKKYNIITSLRDRDEDEEQKPENKQASVMDSKKKKKKKSSNTVTSDSVNEGIENAASCRTDNGELSKEIDAESGKINSTGEKLKNKKKGKNPKDTLVKKEIGDSNTANSSGNQVESGSKKKRKRKKKKQSNPVTETVVTGKTDIKDATASTEHNVEKEKTKKKKKRKQSVPVISDERLKAYGINPKKFKYMNINKHHQE